MKRKAVVIAMTMAIILVVSLVTTLAYFTDQKEVTNTFTVGNLEVGLAEPNYPGHGQKLLPGVTIKKDPTLTIKKGSEPAYAFMLLKPEGNIMNFLKPISILADWKLVTGRTDLYVYSPGTAGPAIVDALAADVVLPSLFATIEVKTDLDNASFSAFNAANDKLTIKAFVHQAYIDGTASYSVAEAAAKVALP